MPICWACSNSKEETTVSDSLQTVLSITAEDSVLLFDNAANIDWLQRSFPISKQLLLKEFWIADSLPLVAFNPKKNFYSDYSSVLRWSADSSYVLDGGSYGGVVIRGASGKTRIEAGEPDVEVAMIFPKQQQRARLVFGGPSTTVINYHWVDRTTAAFTIAFDEKGNQQLDTTLWLVDIKDRYFRKYSYHK